MALRTPYLRILGLEVDNDKTGSGSKRSFTTEEEDEFQNMARSPGFYERFAESIAPSIYGNLGECATCFYECRCVPCDPKQSMLKNPCPSLLPLLPARPRHQESHRVLIDGRLKEDPAGRDAVARRYQRAPTR